MKYPDFTAQLHGQLPDELLRCWAFLGKPQFPPQGQRFRCIKSVVKGILNGTLHFSVNVFRRCVVLSGNLFDEALLAGVPTVPGARAGAAAGEGGA